VVEGGRHELLNDECGEGVLEKVMAWIEGRVAPRDG